MDLEQIEQHWKNWAEKFDTDIRATTKTETIKKLEVAALHRAFKKTPFISQKECHVLEVGCGNGHNCFRLFDLMPDCSFTGVDFIPEMIKNATKIKIKNKEYSNIDFFIGNALTLDENKNLKEYYDIVFTDRCLINLNTVELQINALEQLYKKTKKGGYIIIIENINETYNNQNTLRKSVGLPERTPDKFNLFISDSVLLEYAKKNLTLIDIDDFSSLHDIILYVLTPMLNNGSVDYDSPMVLAATQLLLSIKDNSNRDFGKFGQNRLYIFQKA